MNQPKIMGIPYDPILEPERRIIAFIAELDKSLLIQPSSAEFRMGIQHARHMAEIWFADELKVLNLIKQ